MDTCVSRSNRHYDMAPLNVNDSRRRGFGFGFEGKVLSKTTQFSVPCSGLESDL
jgi:hypothetical protein